MAKKVGDVDKKTPEVSGLETTAVIKTKVVSAENIQAKYFTTLHYYKLTSKISGTKMKGNKLVNKWNMSILAKICGLNTS